MKKVFLVATLMLCIPCVARAHDIGVSDATFWIRSTGIDVELYMGLNSGALLIAPPGETIAIAPATFSNYSDRLQAVAPELYILTGGDGATLKPDLANVSMTDQADVRFDLHYPLPAAMPGPLKIHAAYLDKMVENHLGSINVMNAMGDRLGRGDVRPDAPDLNVNFPAAGLGVIAHPASSAALAQPREHKPAYLWALLVGGVLMIVVVAIRGVERQSVDRRTNA